MGESITVKLRNMFAEYGRVLRVTKKPTGEEFRTVMKVSGLGILAIGFIGFVLQMIRYFLFMGK
jgi:protein transport protein SEC61 subunit gamma and related proteins